MVQGFEDGPASGGEFLEGAVIQILKFLRNGLVQLCQAEESMVSQGSQDPAFGQKDRRFDFGFILGFSDPGRDHDGAVVFGEILIGGIQIGFIAARVRHSYFKVVRVMCPIQLCGHRRINTRLD